MEEEKLTLATERHLPLRVVLKRMIPYLAKEWWAFLVAFICLGLQVVLGLLIPLMQEGVIALLEGQETSITQFTEKIFSMDAFNVPASKVGLYCIISLGTAFILIAIVQQVFVHIDTIVLSRAGERIVYRMRNEVFGHIESMSQNQLTQMPVGSLVTRVANYTTDISNLFVSTIVNILVNVLTVIGVFIIMLVLNPILGSVMAGFMVVLFIYSYFFNKIVNKLFHKERKAVSDFNSFLTESLSGMKIIQIFNKEKDKYEEFEKKNKNLFNIHFKVVLCFAFYRPVVSFMYFAAIGATFYLGPALSLAGHAVVAFYLYLSSFFNPIQNIADQLNNIQRGATALERIFNLLDVKPEVRDVEDAIELGEVHGKIEFRNVWFAYVGEEWILKDVSFVVEPKTTCAFVGATGAGKTTILGLIARNFEPQKGEILIDDIPINKIKLTSLRGALGQMLQDVFLFSGTVKDNITLHDEDIPMEDIENACKYVNADSFINKMPEGLNSELAERGENLSQGQRQLLSFARTVLHDPKILILDEATANIDTETEHLIQESLEKMKSIGTMLVVAHRLSTIQKSDQIIVLHKGVLKEKGTHQELLKMRGRYYKLYQVQFEEK
ncbi:MAG: ABC transporter ATP-binding protein/permease [Bacilli bacterium]|nr:ABC transporter ATP-binding protein/permease [Bacilli bacterium]